MFETMNFPKELVPFKEKFERSIKPTIRIVTEKRQTRLQESKFGGNPYLPKNFEYPLDSRGLPLILLAQFNFEEMPQIKPFPQIGILQFYISQKEHLGVNYKDQIVQKDFKVLYFDEIMDNESDLISDFKFIKYNKEFPIQAECSLKFSMVNECINTTDELAFNKIFNKEPIDFFEDEELFEDADDIEKYFNYFASFAQGHKIGGYPYFIHNDPRYYDNRYESFDTLLLQIDTDESETVRYGMRGGVANFLINEQDLANSDFSRVMYHWRD
ncbi:YwqG family protein [Paenibacillus glacialis]|uniref:DUF1963 domain-containing protein n=1 Tax=Paenibacillus glacialis TaxID=494026 RepID=A0A162K689_9BACL|nr:DUF1963 domain-containing protein [Paenibacillus glacialis]OAB41318.1 hypothetical protein PGLA_16040 [Paenibacillus glacialis]